jgi:putative tryptophan/tyrosine transport system substrate-binding protein
MSKKIILLRLCSLLLAPFSAVEAQQPKKIPRIGWLSGSPLSAVSFRRESFRQGLGELGYIEGEKHSR